METRPFLKRLFSTFLRTKQKLAQPELKTTHIFPLPPPKTQERITRRVSRSRRVRIPWNPPVTDPRFNHALRPSHIARAAQKKQEVIEIEESTGRVARVFTEIEKLPDSCLHDARILAQLGYEKID